MSIINTNPTPPPTLTPDQRQAQMLQQQLQNLYSQVGAVFQRASAFIWNRPDKNPQNGFNAFGTNSGDLVKLSDLYLSLVGGYTGTTPPSPVPAGYSLTVNADGTVTVSGQPTAQPAAAAKAGSGKARG